ncbi:hypothetical protein RUM43_005799 [Polyplax serrata]|uniref:Uncharacterized protein n=1 Tax=Polyplax serrata TaxID=468196 RepID=A0AAN8PK06_POLSC
MDPLVYRPRSMVSRGLGSIAPAFEGVSQENILEGMPFMAMRISDQSDLIIEEHPIVSLINAPGSRKDFIIR